MGKKCGKIVEDVASLMIILVGHVFVANFGQSSTITALI